MNSRHLSGLVALLMLGMTGVTHAEDCQISLSQPVVDYHEMRQDTIEATQQDWHKMADRDITVNVFCPQTQQMAVLLRGTAGDKGRFLFGQSGGVAVKIDNMTVDGKSYSVGKTVDQLNFTPENGTPTPLYLRNNEAVIAFSHLTDQTTLESDLSWSLLTK